MTGLWIQHVWVSTMTTLLVLMILSV